MTQKSVGRDTPDEWEVVDSTVADDRGAVWFTSPDAAGVRVKVTVLLDGTVIGFSVDDEGNVAGYHYLEPGASLPPLSRVMTSRLVRSVPLAGLAQVARATLRADVERIIEYGTSRTPPRHGSAERDDQLMALRGRGKRPGRRGHPDSYHARLAVEYETWLDSGERLAVLAERVHLTESGLRAALNVARSKGLLTDAPRGRAGGEATERARRLLRDEGEG